MIAGGVAVLASVLTTLLLLGGIAGLSGDRSTPQATSVPSPSRPAAPQTTAPTSASPSPSTEAEPQPATGGPGEAVAAADGVLYTVTDLTCGLPAVGEAPSTVAARGQFCVVDVTVANGSNAPVGFSPVGSAAYAGEVAFGVPTGTTLDRAALVSDDGDPGVSTSLS